MESEFEQRLYRADKEHLIQLLRELAVRHPVLLSEMATILDGLSDGTDEEFTEDWDFSGDDQPLFHTLPRPPLYPLDSEEYRQRFTEYALHLSQEELPEVLAEDLAELQEEAELRAEHHDYQGALNIYALIIDERLHERVSTHAAVFDETIQALLPTMEIVLGEVSSQAMFDTTGDTLASLGNIGIRQAWVKRLFALWLKWLDMHMIEEDLPRIILQVAWSEDVPLLRSLIQGELQKLPPNGHSNIVDFTRQYHTRALEKFLRELPRM